MHGVTIGLSAGLHCVGDCVLLPVQRIPAFIHPLVRRLFDFGAPLLQEIGPFPGLRPE